MDMSGRERKVQGRVEDMRAREDALQKGE